MTRATGRGRNDTPQAKALKDAPSDSVGPRQALRLYRDLGPRRSIPSLSEVLQERFAGLAVPSSRMLGRWARDGDWNRLCALWDRANHADPLVTAWRQLAKQIMRAHNAPEPPTLRECRVLVSQVHALCDLVDQVDQVEKEQERQRQARREELRREGTTAKKRLAWILRQSEIFAAENSRTNRCDRPEALADRTIDVARRVSQALLRWSRLQPNLGSQESDTGFAIELVLKRAPL